MVGLIFVPFGSACILGEFKLAAALGDAKQAECERLMLGYGAHTGIVGPRTYPAAGRGRPSVGSSPGSWPDTPTLQGGTGTFANELTVRDKTLGSPYYGPPTLGTSLATETEVWDCMSTNKH